MNKSPGKRYDACPDMAEKEGFEPSIPLWGIHDFQSCALDRATRLLHVKNILSIKISLVIINYLSDKVKCLFRGYFDL